jgi:hypothetical protein
MVGEGTPERTEQVEVGRQIVTAQTLSEAERVAVTSVDLTGLEELPTGLTLEGLPFVEMLRLPTWLRRIPAAFCKDCPRLSWVNTGECAELRDIGIKRYRCALIMRSAFSGCVSLRGIEIPDCAWRVDVSGSGVESLDLRGSRAERVVADHCPLLRRVSMRAECVVECRGCGSLKCLTFGSVGRVPGHYHGRGCEWRYGAAVCRGGREPVRRATIISELAAVGDRAGRPCLPT